MSLPESRIPIASLTTREQLAITLRVPASGTEWIDDMIHKALRLEFLKEQYRGICSDADPEAHRVMDPQQFIEEAFEPGSASDE